MACCSLWRGDANSDHGRFPVGTFPGGPVVLKCLTGLVLLLSAHHRVIDGGLHESTHTTNTPLLPPYTFVVLVAAPVREHDREPRRLVGVDDSQPGAEKKPGY